MNHSITKTITYFETGSHGILPKFEWHNIPMLSIISGLNGCGKTQLLSCIQNLIITGGNHDKWGKAEISKNIERTEVLKTSIANIGKLYSGGANYSGIKQKATQDIWSKRGSYKDLFDSIKTRTGIDVSKNGNDFSRLINNKEILNYYINLNSQQDYTPISLSLIMAAYDQIINDEILKSAKKGEILSKENLFEIIGINNPIDEINSIFEEYNYHFKIAKELCIEPHYNFNFININKGNDEPHTGLSTGESLIINLMSLYYTIQIGRAPKLILLDEPDAGLNPALSELLLKIIKDKFINNGIQVILTTHSLATVAHADESEVFWMDADKGIIPQNIINKAEVLSKLSSGVITLDESINFISAINKDSYKKIIFTEGITDVIHIKHAAKVLGYENLDVFDCDCANQLQKFLEGVPASNSIFKGKSIIGVFDYDGEGLKCIKNIKYANAGKNGKAKLIQDNTNKNLYQSKLYNNIFAITLPCPSDKFESNENCPIEFLYNKDLLLKHNMIKLPDNSISDNLWDYKLKPDAKKHDFATWVTNNLTDKESFNHFKPLLDLLLQVNCDND